MDQCGFNGRIVNGQYAASFSRRGAALAQTGNIRQCIGDLSWNQLLRNTPAKHSLEATGLLVDRAAGPACGDKGVHHGLQCNGTEVAHGFAAIKTLQVPECTDDRHIFTRESTVFAVVVPGEVQVGDNQLVDAEIVAFGCAVAVLANELSTLLQPLADQTVVFGPADFGAVGPEIEIAIAERH